MAHAIFSGLRESRSYEHGVYPSICVLEDNTLIEVHGTSDFNGHTVLYTTGIVKR